MYEFINLFFKEHIIANVWIYTNDVGEKYVDVFSVTSLLRVVTQDDITLLKDQSFDDDDFDQKNFNIPLHFCKQSKMKEIAKKNCKDIVAHFKFNENDWRQYECLLARTFEQYDSQQNSMTGMLIQNSIETLKSILLPSRDDVQTSNKYFNFLKAWNFLKKYCKGESSWIANLLEKLETTDFDETVLLFAQFDKQLRDNGLICLLTRLIPFIHSKFTINDKRQNLSNSPLFESIEHIMPKNNPLHLLCFKLIQNPISKKKSINENEITENKLKSLNDLKSNWNWNKIEIPKELIKFPSSDSFNLDNATKHFQNTFDKYRVKSLLFLELSCREIINYSEVVAVVNCSLNSNFTGK